LNSNPSFWDLTAVYNFCASLLETAEFRKKFIQYCQPTHSMVQSSWQADSYSYCQQIPFFLWNPNGHLHVHLVLSFLSILRSPKWAISFMIPNQNVVRISHLPHVSHITPWFYHPNNIMWRTELRTESKSDQGRKFRVHLNNYWINREDLISCTWCFWKIRHHNVIPGCYADQVPWQLTTTEPFLMMERGDWLWIDRSSSSILKRQTSTDRFSSCKYCKFFLN